MCENINSRAGVGNSCSSSWNCLPQRATNTRLRSHWNRSAHKKCKWYFPMIGPPQPAPPLDFCLLRRYDESNKKCFSFWYWKLGGSHIVQCSFLKELRFQVKGAFLENKTWAYSTMCFAVFHFDSMLCWRVVFHPPWLVIPTKCRPAELNLCGFFN